MVTFCFTDIQRDRQTYRHTNIRIIKQTDIQTDRQTDRQTECSTIYNIFPNDSDETVWVLIDRTTEKTWSMVVGQLDLYIDI